MALKVLMLKRKRDALQKQLDELREKNAGFEAREKELEEAISELKDDATEEERSAVQEEVEAFEAERAKAKKREKELEQSVSEVESEIEELEEAQPGEGGESAGDQGAASGEQRGMEGMYTMRKAKLFRNMAGAEVNAMLEREDVKEFLTRVREAMGNKRALTNVGLTVPDVFIGIIRENMENYSKLYKHVNVRQIGGKGRLVVMGTIPEAVWTEMCGAINEMDLVFNNVEVDGYKVGGYIDVCNASLEDSDIELASELMIAIGQAIGLALDKAIVFGTGVKMPLGFMKRLEQTSAPADYPASARPWVDLHEKNIKSTDKTGVDLFKDIMMYSAAAKGKYSRGEKVWTMNETTYTYLKAQALSINAAGAIVSGVEGTMPVVGGIVEVLEFIPDNMILGGFGDLYLLAERAGVELSQSEHVMFLQDRTVFKGTARYDGSPAIAEGFVAIGVQNTTPSSANITFAPDDANAEESE